MKIWALRFAAWVGIAALAALYGWKAMAIGIVIWGLAHEIGYAVCESELHRLIRRTDALLDVVENRRLAGCGGNKSPGGDYAAW